ncbi:hypothetical protein [Cellulomonas bogoriensis]|uniref:Secreted protein n=1 Tax=Cellulomonas bogoriensis 69B4 = DSM 16987 TaxID=1386082 RepID=A0A0A0C564_9CELL|nr:hypothetical protein [Cellulomonas bogoriensis]KGM14519.1 hypothetical protein N869_08985 [Cellulomonas bogoriensis 69B4 = DSM 16987]
MNAHTTTALQLALLELAMRPAAAAPPSRTAGLPPQFTAMLAGTTPQAPARTQRTRPGLLRPTVPSATPAPA